MPPRFYKSLIIFLTLSLMAFYVSCGQIVTPEPITRYIQDDEILSTIRSVLVTEGSQSKSTLPFNFDIIIKNFDPQNIDTYCNSSIDTTIAISIDEDRILLNSETQVLLNIECGPQGIPNKIGIKGAGEGSFSSDNISGNFLLASSYEGQLSLPVGIMNMTGTTGQTGSIFFEKQSEKATTSIRFQMDEFRYNFLTQTIVSGMGKFQLSYTIKEVEESYEATATFLGNQMITIQMNGNTYLIDLNE